MSYIPESLRRIVTERAKSRCEYCLVSQAYRLVSHEVDHIIPEKHRGKTSEENLCLSCLHCNRNKGSDFASFDPLDDKITLLFNPRKDTWEEHFRLEGGKIMPLTPVGRVTVFILNFNQEERVKFRESLIRFERYP